MGRTMSMLRTPEERFSDLPGFDYEPNYVEVDGARMAYVDEGGASGGREAEETILCLHGEPTYSFLYRKMIPRLSEVGRVVVPDFPGFGRSDKYPELSDYDYDLFYDALVGFVEALDLSRITLVCQDWGGLLGLPLAALEMPERFARVVPMNTGLPDGTQEPAEEWWEFHDFVAEVEDLPIGTLVANGCATDLPDEVVAAYEAPFPDASYKAGARAWPLLVPTSPDDGGAAKLREAQEAFQSWEKPAFVLFSDSDPITGGTRDPLRELIPTASDQPDVWIEGAAHFLQEDAGEEIAERVADFVEQTEP